MGLDMYMKKTKKVAGMTVKEISEVWNYIDYLDRPEEYRNCSYKEWCGRDEANVRKDKIDDIRANVHMCYCSWDDEHKYGFHSVFDGIAYWRKANAIHNWFVENCGDGIDECQLMEISKEQLERLLDTAKEVRTSCVLVPGKIFAGYTYENGREIKSFRDGKCVKDPSVAERLLPTADGFFFGNTEYDERYVNNLDSTIEQITQILETTDFETEHIIYQASW